MRRRRFIDHFRWIRDDFRRAVDTFSRRETWLLMAMLALFGALIYSAFHFALRLDGSLRLRGVVSNACQDIGNGQAALLFFSILGFTLTMLLAFGEFAHWLDDRRRGRRHGLTATVLTFVAALAIGGVALFLASLCS